ncbi:MAG: hypothetical protein ACK4ST_09855 [Elioraea tepidiphila]
MTRDGTGYAASGDPASMAALDAFAEAVARAGGEIKVDVIKAKPRAVKETH